METITIDDFKANTKEWLIEKLFCMPLDEALQAICTLHDELNKYPKTYEECCKVLGYKTEEDEICCYKGHLIGSFVNLLTCRDAYWKIAGDWKPNWKDFSTQKYSISVDKDDIILSQRVTGSRIFIFPTKEMRNTFYENFKDLIEQCKELL